MTALPLRAALAAPALAATILGVALHPTAPWPLAAFLLAIAALTWWRPAAFLITLPATMAALDLGAWTGWTMISESDLVFTATLAVLFLRPIAFAPAPISRTHRTTPIVSASAGWRYPAAPYATRSTRAS